MFTHKGKSVFVVLVIVAVALVIAPFAGAQGGKPDRWHEQVEGSDEIRCAYDSDPDGGWDYIILGHFWQEIQNFYFYDKAGNVVKVKTNSVWHGQLTDPATGKTFTEKAASSEQYDPKDWPVVVEAVSGNFDNVHVPGSAADVHYHPAGRLILKWYMEDPNDPSKWVLLEVLHQSGRWPSAPELCKLFGAEGHFVEQVALSRAVRELQ